MCRTYFARAFHGSLFGKCVASGSLFASVLPFSHVTFMYLFEFMLLRFRSGVLRFRFGVLWCVWGSEAEPQSDIPPNNYRQKVNYIVLIKRISREQNQAFALRERTIFAREKSSY